MLPKTWERRKNNYFECFCLFVYLKERVRSSIYWFIWRVLTLSWARWKVQAENPILACHRCVRHPSTFCFPECVLVGSWTQKQSQGLNPGNPKWNVYFLSSILTVEPNVYYSLFFMKRLKSNLLSFNTTLVQNNMLKVAYFNYLWVWQDTLVANVYLLMQPGWGLSSASCTAVLWYSLQLISIYFLNVMLGIRECSSPFWSL